MVDFIYQPPSTGDRLAGFLVGRFHQRLRPWTARWITFVALRRDQGGGYELGNKVDPLAEGKGPKINGFHWRYNHTYRSSNMILK